MSTGPTIQPPESGPPRKKITTVQIFLKGLAIGLPPILTLVILIWIAGTVYSYVIQPISTSVQFSIAHLIDRSVETESLIAWNDKLPPLDYVGRDYRISRNYRDDLQQLLLNEHRDEPVSQWPDIRRQQLDLERVYVPMGSRAVPYPDYGKLAKQMRTSEIPATATGLYMVLVTQDYFRSYLNLSVAAVIVVIVGVYFLGRFVTARLGAWIVHKFETLILGQLPLVSNVYSAVKQVTDFVFSERTIEYSRVVALEYPRRGLWSLGFVTGDAMLDVTAAAGEPCVNVLIPSSPMPMTGYTIVVPRSEILDLNITVDQTFQYCISCGVLIPPQQKATPERLQQELARRFAENNDSGAVRGRRKSNDGE